MWFEETVGEMTGGGGGGSQGESSKSISAADAYDEHKAKETNYSPSGVKLREP